MVSSHVATLLDLALGLKRQCLRPRDPFEPFGLFVTNNSRSAHARWKGDHGGNTQKFFPANYIEEVSNSTQPDTKAQVEIRAQASVALTGKAAATVSMMCVLRF